MSDLGFTCPGFGTLLCLECFADDVALAPNFCLPLTLAAFEKGCHRTLLFTTSSYAEVSQNCPI